MGRCAGALRVCACLCVWVLVVSVCASECLHVCVCVVLRALVSFIALIMPCMVHMLPDVSAHCSILFTTNSDYDPACRGDAP